MAVEIFFAAVSAICATVQVMMMQESRLAQYEHKFPEIRSQQPRTDLPADYLSLVSDLNKEAIDAGQESFNLPDWNVNSNPVLSTVARRIPDAILEAMKNNVYRCWTRLEHFISDNIYTPEERQRAHVLARQCVCTELQELLNYLGELPEELQAYWNACGCPSPIQLLNKTSEN